MARQPKFEDEDYPMSLAGVIDLAYIRTGAVSSRELEAYARRYDKMITHTTINAIKAGTYPSKPKPKTIDALAFLAGLPVNAVRRAADLPVSNARPFAEQLPPDVDELEPRPRAALLEMARLLLDFQRRGAGTDTGISTASLRDLGLSGERLNTDNPQEGRPSGG